MSDPLGLIHTTGPIAPLRPPGPLGGPQANRPVEGPSFKDTLMREIEEVDQLQQQATRAIEDFSTGRRDDIEGVMQATLHADTAFQMLMQVRNKMMDAYEEVKQIRV